MHNHTGHRERRQEADVPRAAGYSCPMHPEVRAQQPGTCPKCGMALEPVSPAVPATKTEMGLPHAPGDRSGRARQLSQVRHGPGTPDRDPRRRGKPGTQGYEPALLDQCPADRSAGRRGDGSTCSGHAVRWTGFVSRPELAGTGAGHAGGVVGRLAVFRTGLAIPHQSQPQYVHLDQPGCGGGVYLQHCGDAATGTLSTFLPRCSWRSCGVF